MVTRYTEIVVARIRDRDVELRQFFAASLI
jgi:hypothetical protein